MGGVGEGIDPEFEQRVEHVAPQPLGVRVRQPGPPRPVMPVPRVRPCAPPAPSLEMVRLESPRAPGKAAAAVQGAWALERAGKGIALVFGVTDGVPEVDALAAVQRALHTPCRRGLGGWSQAGAGCACVLHGSWRAGRQGRAAGAGDYIGAARPGALKGGEERGRVQAAPQEGGSSPSTRHDPGFQSQFSRLSGDIGCEPRQIIEAHNL